MKKPLHPTKRLLDHCWQIAERCADSTGFVSIRTLAQYCRCEVISRPLLVEAAITRRKGCEDSWVALVNREIHNFHDEDFELESTLSPLGARTRNTIAHEIAHAVAYDMLGKDLLGSGSAEKRIRWIEDAVEAASPLLLLPRSALEAKIGEIKVRSEALKKLTAINAHFAVSAHVFFNSLKLLSKFHRAKFLEFDGTLEAVWGVAEIISKNKFRINTAKVLINLFREKPPAFAETVGRVKSSEWTIQDLYSLEGRTWCDAVSESHADSKMPIQFELPKLSLKAGQSILFRVGSKESLRGRPRLWRDSSQWQTVR